jgi:hypothetical protein
VGTYCYSSNFLIEFFTLVLDTHAKVDYSDDGIGLLVKVDYVFRLKISVHDTLTVAEDHSSKNLLHDLDSFEFGEFFLICDFIKKLSTTAQLSNNVQMILVLKVLINLENVRMVEFTQNINLGELDSAKYKFTSSLILASSTGLDLSL